MVAAVIFCFSDNNLSGLGGNDITVVASYYL